MFARATWRLTREDLRPLKEAPAGAAQYAAVQRWRATRRLPRWVVLTDQDNTLPVDLDNALAVDSLIHLLKERESATLTEMYPGAEDLCAEGDDGRYVHELLIPCVRAKTVESATVSAPEPTPCASPRDPDSADVRPGIGMGVRQAVRGREHRRPIAVRADRPGQPGVAVEGLHRSMVLHPLRRSRRTSPMAAACGRQDARLDRAAPRRASHHDSAVRAPRAPARLRHLRARGRALRGRRGGGRGRAILLDRQRSHHPAAPSGDGHRRPMLRWQAAIPGIDTLLSDFGFDLDAKLRVDAERCATRFGREFHADPPFARQLAAKYRAVKRDLQRLLGPEASAPSTPWLDAFDRRSARARETLTTLRAAEHAKSAGRSDRRARGELRAHARQPAVQGGTARTRAGDLRLPVVPVRRSRSATPGQSPYVAPGPSHACKVRGFRGISLESHRLLTVW